MALPKKMRERHRGRRASGNDEEFSGTKPVEERHRIDEVRLDGWMREACRRLSGAADRPAIQGRPVEPDLPARYAGRSYVMRRKPFGKLLPSAHAVDREFRVIAALGKQGFPVAQAYALCTDEAVIGAAFYIMSMEEGRVFWDPTLPSQTPEARHAIFTRQDRDAGETPHLRSASDRPWRVSASPAIISRARSIAGPSNTAPRKPSTSRKFEKLIEWLPQTVPQQQRVSIVHGDYRLDNMIFHPTEPRVIAVLDWELSTLGDPMADFTYLLMQWTMPGLANADLKALNIPSLERGRTDLLQRHRQRGARPELVFFLQSVPARRHYPRHRRPHPRRHRGERQGDGIGRAHRAAVEGLLGIRAEGGRGVAVSRTRCSVA